MFWKKPSKLALSRKFHYKCKMGLFQPAGISPSLVEQCNCKLCAEREKKFKAAFQKNKQNKSIVHTNYMRKQRH